MVTMDSEHNVRRVALVAGATRGAGRAIAVELTRAGLYVYATGRSSRAAGRSEIGRPETIEETGDLMAAVGGHGTALVVDHEDPKAVADLVARIESERGRLDVLVNDIFGGDRYAQWHTPMWEHDLAGGLRMLRMGVDTHLITAHAALPLLLRGDRGLLVEMTDGTAEVNASYREGVGFFYDLVKANVSRIVLSLSHELRDRPVTALGVTPGWLRSEAMLDGFGVTEATWRNALARMPGFAISESPTYVARGVAALAQDPEVAQFAGQVLTARQYGRLTTGRLGLHRHLRDGGTERQGRRAVPLRTNRTGATGGAGPLSIPGDRVVADPWGLLEGCPEPAKEVARAHTGRGGEPGGAGAEDGPALSRGDDHHHAAAATRRQPRAARLPAHPGGRAGTGDPLRVPVRAVLPQA
jgi:NAD(P)-dependent dehydrogenase (short-subunit alcohol dehydrogenase family)